VRRHHEVVEDTDVDEVECVLEGAGQQFVGGARLGCARWVVVREDHPRGVMGKGEFYDLARVDRGLGECRLSSDLLSYP
jgi:hypothetical protein